MHVFSFIVSIAGLLIWLVLFFFRGSFWRVSQSSHGGPFKPSFGLSATKEESDGAPFKPDFGLSGTKDTLVSQVREANLGTSPPTVPRIAAIIPARNEADVIARAITSLLQQSGDLDLQIFLIDDASTDATAARARETAASLGHLDRLTVLNAGPLPPGWTGKLWAVRAGIEASRAFTPDYLLLTDADIIHAPDSLATLISISDSGPYDLTSFMVKLHCASFAERLLIPAFVYFFFQLYPPRWIASPRHRTAGAAGGCVLVRPAALDRAGGIDAIRSEIIDDCALAARIKRTGGRVWLGLPPHNTAGPNDRPITASIRRYDTFAAIEHMIARTAFNQLRHSALLLLGCILGLALTYLAPIAILFAGHLLPTILGATAFALMTATYFPMTRFYGLNPLWSLSLPAAAVFYMFATVHSALNYWTGHGGQWKGRSQDHCNAPL